MTNEKKTTVDLAQSQVNSFWEHQKGSEQLLDQMNQLMEIIPAVAIHLIERCPYYTVRAKHQSAFSK